MTFSFGDALGAAIRPGRGDGARRRVTRKAPVHLIRAAAGAVTPLGEREFECIAATSDLQPDGFALVMAGADLSRARDGRMPVLFNHDPEQLVGKVISARVTATQLIIRGARPAPGISRIADEAGGMMAAGFLNGISIGFDVTEAEPIDPYAPRKGLRATAWTLFEVTLASVPMDPAATVTQRQRRAALAARAAEVDPVYEALVAAGNRIGVEMTRQRAAWIAAEAERLGIDPVQRFLWVECAGR